MLDFQQTNDGCQVAFHGELSIFHAQDLFEKLQPLLLEIKTISFDLTNIESIDTSVMRSFMFIKSFLKKHDCELHLMNHSPAVLSLMERLGLVNWFNDPVILAPDEADAKRKNPGDKA